MGVPIFPSPIPPIPPSGDGPQDAAAFTINADKIVATIVIYLKFVGSVRGNAGSK